MQKNNKTILIILIFIILIIILTIQNPFSKKETVTRELQDNENTGLDIGNQAPDFILNSINNKNVQLSSFRGKKAVAVNFWAAFFPETKIYKGRN